MFRAAVELLSVLLLILTMATPVLAAGSDEIEDLRRRLEKLEGREGEAEGFSLAAGRKFLSFTGILEVEAGYLKARDLPAESDINVATALINFDVSPSDRVKGRIALLHEEGEEPTVDIDEAYIAYRLPGTDEGSLNVTVGKTYLPFGSFNSGMVSDPLTLELGEVNKSALLAGWEKAKVAVTAGVFNGDRDITGHNVIDNGVIGVSLSPTEKIGLGLSYICDLAETNADLLADTTTDYEENVNSISAFLSVDLSLVTLNLEYLGALRKFSEAMLADLDHAAELTGRKPRAWFAELAFVPNEDLEFSGRYEQARDYRDNLARYGVTVSYGLDFNTVLSLEYLYSDYDREAESTASQITAQLALEF